MVGLVHAKARKSKPLDILGQYRYLPAKYIYIYIYIYRPSAIEITQQKVNARSHYIYMLSCICMDTEIF